jgi:COP9 signalosome complex subunit 1
MEMDIDVETPQNDDVTMDFQTEESSSKKRKQTIVPATTLDLDSYIGNYHGHSKIIRLVYIAEICPSLRIEALHIALKELKQTLDTEKYVRVQQMLNDALGSQGMDQETLDTQWIEQTRRSASQTSIKLDADLKNYKNSLIKESIRVLQLIRWDIQRWVITTTVWVM